MPEPIWLPIATGPQTATWVMGKLADGKEVRMHWACDLSGEDQPAFKGWFEEVGTGAHRWFRGVDPAYWRPINA